MLELRGLSRELVRLGNTAHGGCVYGGGKRIFRFDFTQVDSRYNYLLLVSQAETERILRTAIETHGVTIERGVELVGLAQDPMSDDPSPVRAILRHSDGRLEQAQAPWLIDAEGAHSAVRTTLDLPFEGKTFDDHFALGDLHIDGDLAETDFHIFSSEHGFMALFPMGGRRFRLIVSDPIGEPNTDTAPRSTSCKRLYDERSHIPARLGDMTWSSWFHINSRMITRLQVGRLLLGGDAAHIHSPAGGQGMNTGIQDMINLAWKLALVIKGQADRGLARHLRAGPLARDSLRLDQDRRPDQPHRLRESDRPRPVQRPRPLGRRRRDRAGGRHIVDESGRGRLSPGPPLGDHGHGGDLHAGDRVADMPVRCDTTANGTTKIYSACSTRRVSCCSSSIRSTRNPCRSRFVMR